MASRALHAVCQNEQLAISPPDMTWYHVYRISCYIRGTDSLSCIPVSVFSACDLVYIILQSADMLPVFTTLKHSYAVHSLCTNYVSHTHLPPSSQLKHLISLSTLIWMHHTFRPSESDAASFHHDLPDLRRIQHKLLRQSVAFAAECEVLLSLCRRRSS